MVEIFNPSEKHKLESEFRRKMLPVGPVTDFISSAPSSNLEFIFNSPHFLADSSYFST